MAVVVDVAHGDPVAVTAGIAGEARDAVASSNVPSPRLRNRRSPSVRGRSRSGGNGPPCTQVDVEPAVAVVVEQSDAAGLVSGMCRDVDRRCRT